MMTHAGCKPIAGKFEAFRGSSVAIQAQCYNQIMKSVQLLSIKIMSSVYIKLDSSENVKLGYFTLLTFINENISTNLSREHHL